MMLMEGSDMVDTCGFLNLNCLKGLDELPSGMVFCLILAPRCEFLSLEPRFERAAIGGCMGALLTK